MLFNSIEFVFFFPVVVALYTLLRSSWTARKALLLASSYLFYMAWNPPYALLLTFSTLLDYIAGKQIAQTGAQNPLVDQNQNNPRRLIGDDGDRIDAKLIAHGTLPLRLRDLRREHTGESIVGFRQRTANTSTDHVAGGLPGGGAHIIERSGTV